MALLVNLRRERAAVGDVFSHAFRLVRKNTRSADLGIQQATGGQRGIAESSRLADEHADHGQADDSEVLFEQYGIDLRRLPVSRRRSR